jgi:hypothetical protein
MSRNSNHLGHPPRISEKKNKNAFVANVIGKSRLRIPWLKTRIALRDPTGEALENDPVEAIASQSNVISNLPIS